MLAPIVSNRRRLWLAVGDLVAFLAFAAVGRQAHSMGSALDDVLGSALPFVVGWFVVAPFTGAFGPAATGSARSGAARAALTWLFAFPLGLLVRAGIVGRWAHYTFAIVAGAFTLLVLVGWRALYARSRA